MNAKNVKVIAFALMIAIVLSAGAVALRASVIVPCTHLVPAHPAGDVVYGPYGPYIVPCTHLVPLHPAGDIIYP